MAFIEEDIPPKMSDVLRRRFLSLDGETRFRVFRTRGILMSFWREGNSTILMIGDSQCQAQARSFVKRYGTPLVGTVFSMDGPQALFYCEGRKVIFVNAQAENLNGPVYRIPPGGSLFSAKSVVAISMGGKRQLFSYQCYYANHLSPEFTLEEAIEDLESVLIRMMDPHIKRVTLDHAS